MEHFLNNSKCPCCQIGEVVENLLQQHGQFIDVIENNDFEQDLFPVLDALEDCFTKLYRAKIKLLQLHGNEVFLSRNEIEYIPYDEDMDDAIDDLITNN